MYGCTTKDSSEAEANVRKVLDKFFPNFKSVSVLDLLLKGITTLILASGSVLILIPFLYMISTSLKDPAQIRSDSSSLIPRKPKTAEINGNPEPLYEVTIDGQVHEYALIKNLPDGLGQFVDP